MHESIVNYVGKIPSKPKKYISNPNTPTNKFQFRIFAQLNKSVYYEPKSIT